MRRGALGSAPLPFGKELPFSIPACGPEPTAPLMPSGAPQWVQAPAGDHPTWGSGAAGQRPELPGLHLHCPGPRPIPPPPLLSLAVLDPRLTSCPPSSPRPPGLSFQGGRRCRVLVRGREHDGGMRTCFRATRPSDLQGISCPPCRAGDVTAATRPRS